MSASAYRAKVKTPFELVVSTLRAMNAPPDTTARDAQLVARLGQPIWGHLTPEGWPDQGDAWLNAGSLLNRVNFLTSAAEGRVPGVSVAHWGPAKRLVTLEPKEMVQGVVDELLGGRASPATQGAMLSACNEVTPSPRTPYARLVAVVGVALSSPEFQRR